MSVVIKTTAIADMIVNKDVDRFLAIYDQVHIVFVHLNGNAYLKAASRESSIFYI